MSTITGARYRPYSLRFAQPVPTPFGFTRYRRGWLLELADEEGRSGYGDAAPWPGFGSSVNPSGPARIEGDLEALVAWIEAGPRPMTAVEEKATTPEVAFAAEAAVFDLRGQAAGRPYADLLEETASRDVALHQFVGFGDTPLGPGPYKLKLGARAWSEEHAWLKRVRTSRPAVELRLDAGGRWTAEQARRALDDLGALGAPMLLEQPLDSCDWTELAAFRRTAAVHGIRIALDESIRTARDVEAAAAARAADAVVLKPMFIGGGRKTLALARSAREAGLDVIVTHALESAVGRAATIHIAAAIGPGPHGLGDPFVRDLARLPRAVDGRRALPPGAGLGVVPPPEDNRPAVPHPLRSAAIARPEHPALVTGDQELTYRALESQVVTTAAAFRARGVTATTRLGLVVRRDIESIVALHAAGWLGATVCPLPPGDDPDAGRVRAALAPDLVIDGLPVTTLGSESTGERFWPLAETRFDLATSGSTGSPKPISLSTRQLLLSAFGSAIRLGLASSDRWLHALPLHHVGGLAILIRSLFYETTVSLAPAGRFDAAALWQRLNDEPITIVSFVPTMLERVLDTAGDAPWPDRVRAILVGGAAVSPTLRARYRARGLPVAESWGMTEAGSQVATSYPGEAQSALPPLPFARIENEGERLVVRGPLVGSAGRWASSDRGRVEHGRVAVQGRLDDVIVTGGKKVSAARIVTALETHPAVDEAAVLKLRTSTWGESPLAVVVGRPASASDLDDHLRRQLAGWEQPKTTVWLDGPLPRTGLGKVARPQLTRDVIAAAPELAPSLDRFPEEDPSPQSGARP